MNIIALRFYFWGFGFQFLTEGAASGDWLPFNTLLQKKAFQFIGLFPNKDI